MPQRKIHIVIMLVALVAGLLVTSSGQAKPVSMQQHITANDAGALALSVEQHSLASSQQGSHHSAPCYLECQQPFLRTGTPVMAVPAKKDFPANDPLLHHLPGITISGTSSQQEQINLAQLNMQGPPYRAHRARTGRQLT